MEETTVACWERPVGFCSLRCRGLAFCLATAPTAFQHPMRCIVSGFFVRCKNFFKRCAAGPSALHFCRNAGPNRLESRSQQ